MPILLIFLTAAITMRMWAEEHRVGTLEFLLTSPVQPLLLVLGKFLACFFLIVVALLLTLPAATANLFARRLWQMMLLASLACALDAVSDNTVLIYGDLLFRTYILNNLLDWEAELLVVVDSSPLDQAWPGGNSWTSLQTSTSAFISEAT